MSAQSIAARCRKCAHYYRRMVGAEGAGYNPAPACYLYEDTGERPRILTGECYKPRRTRLLSGGNTK